MRAFWLYNAGIRQGSLDFFSFSDDYKIFTLRDLKPYFELNNSIQLKAIEQAIAADPDLSLLDWLAPSKSALPSASSPGMDADLFRIPV